MTKSIENAVWYRKWNIVFFMVSFILFSVPCIYFEMTGAMTLEGRLILYGMLAVITYGMTRSVVLLRQVLGSSSASRLVDAIHSPREELV